MSLDICRSDIVVGKVGSESRPNLVEIVSTLPIPIGTYISIPFNSIDISTGEKRFHCLVGVVSSTSYKRIIPVTPSFMAQPSIAIGIEDDMLRYAPSMARMFVDVIGNDIRVPSVPPQPDTQVYLAPTQILSKIFGGRSSETSIRIGYLIGRPDVSISIDVNALTKHLFITGTTGSGKSNTVAILSDRIASIGGVIAIYDVHGEYTSLQPYSEGVEIKVIDYKLNPLKINPSILARMIIPEAAASIQRALVSKALREVSKLFQEAIETHGVTEEAIEYLRKKRSISNEQIGDLEDEEGDIESKLLYLYREYIKSFIRNKSANNKLFRESAEKACAKVDEFFEYTSLSFKMPRITDLLRPSRILIINSSMLNDEQRDYVLKIILDEILWYTKQHLLQGSPFPVLFFIEEAHLFLSANRTTVSRASIERVAREGRKFGLSLAIVSQRPRNIDPNTLSQVQNFVFMKLVQEQDQNMVMNISDMLTEDLARSLASMDVGEALVMGEWIGRFPVYVKIDRHEGKRIGTSLEISQLWRSLRNRIQAPEIGGRLAMLSMDELKDLL
ncbi:protein of unknown function DUF87 [Ignisphaera aggregans DSM 17230]|uniref:Helicase HerA central domain-containing protein n=1 Tax=Ignisphaera aggregans (strain DSM 17230 / JCM 13409 / AQ1.S1) TaxID=583356 RepID=E0SP07_IGNAA|nr:protein of unknown function DUF87 [Ignisphaera aggregans DSM 17230]